MQMNSHAYAMLSSVLARLMIASIKYTEWNGVLTPHSSSAAKMMSLIAGTLNARVCTVTAQSTNEAVTVSLKSARPACFSYACFQNAIKGGGCYSDSTPVAR